MRSAIIVAHIASAALLAVLFYSDPPMGEAEMHPWDIVAPAASLAVLMLCPLAYLCL